jgi:hypothetical protein
MTRTLLLVAVFALSTVAAATVTKPGALVLVETPSSGKFRSNTYAVVEAQICRPMTRRFLGCLLILSLNGKESHPLRRS